TATGSAPSRATRYRSTWTFLPSRRRTSSTTAPSAAPWSRSCATGSCPWDATPSTCPPTARRHGGSARRGEPVVLVVEAGRMAADGHEFRVSENGVWLTGRVPPEHLRG